MSSRQARHHPTDAAAALLFLLISCVAAGPVLAQDWRQVHDRLSARNGALFSQLEQAHAVLSARVATEDPALLARLSLEPPQPRRSGYQLLPEIRENAPLKSVELQQTVYSLKWVEDQIDAADSAAADLQNRLQSEPEVERLVEDFESLAEQSRTLDSHLAYHAYWQDAVVQYPAYFAKKNRLLALVRKLDGMLRRGEPAATVEETRRAVAAELAPFRATPGLALAGADPGRKRLDVAVCTDIGDPEFLRRFRRGVDQAYNDSSAARAEAFEIELRWIHVTPGDLYGGQPPEHGAKIDPASHRARFANCPLVLTTGAADTHAMTGDRVVLGTRAVSERSLAHEFGHLLGFDDAYLRGFDGDPGDPYGVVFFEWTGLTDDLMGSPGAGAVTTAMVETLLAAYSAPE